MPSRISAIANNDIAYLWWALDHKIPGCLGFSVHRIDATGAEKTLPAFVGFAPGQPGATRQRKNTDIWPIQSFQWKDVFAEPGTYRYRVIPMLGPDPDALVPDVAHAITTPQPVTIGGRYGTLEAYFNVGLISTQAVTRRLNALVRAGTYPDRVTALEVEITKQGSPIRESLCGQVLQEGLLSLLNETARTPGSTCALSLYELTDRELIDAIEVAADRGGLDLCLSNADKTEKYKSADGKEHSRKIRDGTNVKTRSELKARGVNIVDRFVSSSSIGHNKFVVYSSAPGQPKSVLTGSTNWTPTGLCSQTNNALLIHDETIARGYSEYHAQLVRDAAVKPVQGPVLRQWCAANRIEVRIDDGSVTVWMSPNTVRRTKDSENEPPDLAEVFRLIDSAKKGVLFLAFNPGTPSCLERVRAKAEKMKEDGLPFFVRGAVTDPAPLGQFATFLTKRDATASPDVLVSGVAGIPDDFSRWEQELYKIGHAVIHDKILVIDPFTPECVVVTGSHNLGYKASYQNDENLVIVRRHRRLAAAYAAHVLDVTNHFAWRCKLAALFKQNKLNTAWGDLDETDRWQDKYFDPGDSASRDDFFFDS